MVFRESETVELKSVVVDDIKRNYSICKLRRWENIYWCSGRWNGHRTGGSGWSRFAGQEYVRDRDAIKPDLTFEATKGNFPRESPLGEVQMKTLGIMTHDGVYTNLGLLLSDQCVHTIKVTAFEGTTQSQFIEKCSEILFRNSSAAGENTWYFFQIIFRPDSSFGSRGRKQRRLSSEVSVR